MSLGRRLATRFLLWLGLMFVVVTATWYSAILYFFNYYGEECSRDCEDYYEGDWLREIAKGTSIVKGRARVTSRVESTLDKRETGLQILDEQGKEVYRRGMEDHWPRKWNPGYLLREKKLNGRSLFTWHSSKKGESYTWVLWREFGFPLRKLASSVSLTRGQMILSKAWEKKIAKRNAWVQVLDAQGKEMVNYGRPKSFPTHYSSGQLVQRVKSTQDQWQMKVWYDPERKWTWIYGRPGVNSRTILANRWKIVYLWVFFLGIGLALLIAWFFGRRLGAPLIHMMEWLKNLAKGHYHEPLAKSGFPKSRGVDGQSLQRPFRVYQEVIRAMESLTSTLKGAEDERERLERTREEWMTGVSHDLKTPLASIKGYADLLEAEQYHWEEKEVRRYARVVREKAEHMERLLADFNLTFRLENDALPLVKKNVDVVELLRRSAIDLVNHPLSQGQEIHFTVPEELQLTYPLDGHWFKRAIDNLALNALLHNPKGTSIHLEVEEIHPCREVPLVEPGVIIRIRDDGRGMDEETLEHLFERYYRGVSTDYEGGAGLGMAIARRLIEVHGGFIHIQSNVGEGTLVTISLPPKN
ncbi:Signal transduction histidine kinase [Marininema mesophilum]|uniref:histidine kinase n=1 Tax=Marininema mesophilum TaxID=1048340 RepID=A0A1H2W806_9BACL|nr:HAMP domain-containing sensor histidine kinase [Marininema mesophilum]SDW76687.1 Signal transduction histidine kinase [Marininema mesophilum]